MAPYSPGILHVIAYMVFFFVVLSLLGMAASKRLVEGFQAGQPTSRDVGVTTSSTPLSNYTNIDTYDRFPGEDQKCPPGSQRFITTSWISWLSTTGYSYSCHNCRAGYYNESLTADSLCTICPANRYSSAGASLCRVCADLGMASPSWLTGGTCSTCPTGKTPNAGATFCMNCPDGEAEGGGNGLCRKCPAGKSSRAGDSVCSNCPAGKSSIEGGYCMNCPAGKTSIEGGLCTNCDAGKSSTAGSATCTPCDAGKTSIAGGLCTPCPVGKISIAGGQCTNCDAGKSSIAGSATCTNCDAGKTSIAGGPCTNCPAGQTSVAGGTCTPVRIGAYATSGSTQSWCPNGTTTSGLGAGTSVASCTPCPAGTAVMSSQRDINNNQTCVTCPSGTYSNSGAAVCTANDPGYTSAAGASSQTICPVGYSCPRPTTDEVFSVGNHEYTKTQAEAACTELGARLATLAEVQAARADGASWCACGWTSESNTNSYFPMHAALPFCGAVGINTCPPGDPLISTATCYGKKPLGPQPGKVIRAFGPTSYTKVPIVPQRCPAGTYSAAGATTCTAASPGYTSGSTAGTQTICPEGYSCTNPALPPQPCPTGTYSPAGATTCTPASAGYTSGSTAGTQTICPEGYSCSSTTPEVFATRGYNYTYSQAAGVCSALGATVATVSQVTEAQQAGASWCSCSWTTDSTTTTDSQNVTRNIGYYPMQSSDVVIGCGSNGVNQCRDWLSTYAVTCYGIKPSGPTNPELQPFNTTKYNQFPVTPKPCPAGTYSPAGQTTCTTTPAGYYTPDSRMGSYISAALGWFSGSGATSQTICPAGTYCPPNAAAPIPCPRGTFGAVSGLSGSSCTATCPTGTYCDAGVTFPMVCQPSVTITPYT
jgi:hypothetical protein